MKWRDRRPSSNIEDRRGPDGDTGGGMGGFGRGMRGGMRGSRGVRMPGGRGKVGGLGLIVIVVLALLFGVDPVALLQGNGGTDFTVPMGNAPSEPNQIGDDTLQRNVGQAVVPDSFTHGSSQQRMRWFRAGFGTGDPSRCDTINAARL
jgi:predicted metalloprotease